MKYIGFKGAYNEQIYDTETRTITWTYPIVDKEGEHKLEIKEIFPNLFAKYKGRKVWRKLK